MSATPALANTPEPPYYAVIFSSLLGEDDSDYLSTAERMLELAARQPGFLGVESGRAAGGVGITVSYWRDLDAIQAWRVQTEHAEARRLGRERWYAAFRLRVARVEKAISFERNAETAD